MLPFAFFGLLAGAAAALARAGSARGAAREPRAARRRDPRLAAVLVLGGWFAVEALVLSISKGIVHPYYVSALAPGTGAMAGRGRRAVRRCAAGAAGWRAVSARRLAVAGDLAARSS